MEKIRTKGYKELYEAWRKAFPGQKGDKTQQDANAFWKTHKTDLDQVEAKILELDATAKRKSNAQTAFFNRWMRKEPKKVDSVEVPIKSIDTPEQNLPNRSSEWTLVEDNDILRKAPAQAKTQEQLTTVEHKINRLRALDKSGLASYADRRKFNEKMKEKRKLDNKLKRQKQIAENSRKYRQKCKQKMELLKVKHPGLASELGEFQKRSTAGRPRLEEEQPMLLKTIVDIVTPDTSADSRRRTEALRTCLTLEDLRKELVTRGYNLSRSGLYLRLLPRNYTTTEGKRHVTTVPVKLLRAENTGRKIHDDHHFASAVNKFLRNLGEMMGGSSVFALSQDDKARVLLGLPAANKQAPILMHLEYKVRLPDHDWVVAPGHKLIPSVYAGLVIEDRKMTYSGPTYIAVRSGKHDTSNATSHAADFRRLLIIDSFAGISKTSAGYVKPIVIVFTDGGPDENPRFPKVITQFAKHFKEFNLDAVFVATHAPGQSAYNQVERRMAPLSRDLSGLILPHDHFGSHLDESGKTVDKNLELQNFQKAGELLAELWTRNIMNGYNTRAEYVAPGNNDEDDYDMTWMTQEWLTKHVQQSQYCLQIVKCFEINCCGTFRSNINEILPSRFLPAPVTFKQTESGLKLCETNDASGYFGDLMHRITLDRVVTGLKPGLKFDSFCPSVCNVIGERICKACQKYFVTKVSLESHRKAMHRSTVESIAASIERVLNQPAAKGSDAGVVISHVPEFDGTASIDSEIEDMQVQENLAPETDQIQIIDDLNAWISSEFIDI